jgi:hypothetical protein
MIYIVIELDHENVDLYCEEFDNHDAAVSYAENNERKCYLISVAVDTEGLMPSQAKNILDRITVKREPYT